MATGWKHPALCGSASLLSDESFLLIMVAPPALEALLGVWITERVHEHLRMYENCGAGVGGVAVRRTRDGGKNGPDEQLTQQLCLILGIFLRGGWPS